MSRDKTHAKISRMSLKPVVTKFIFYRMCFTSYATFIQEITMHESEFILN